MTSQVLQRTLALPATRLLVRLVGVGTLHCALWRRHPVTPENLWERQRLSRVWSGMSCRTMPLICIVLTPVFSLWLFIVWELSLSHLMRRSVSGDEMGTSNTTKSPGYIYTVAAAIRFITKTYLIPCTHTHTHTHIVIIPHMNRLIFCRKDVSKAKMMQGSVEIRVFFLMTEWCDACVISAAIFIHAQTPSSSVLVKIRENEHDSCSVLSPCWKRIKEYGSGPCGCMGFLKCISVCLRVFFIILNWRLDFYNVLGPKLNVFNFFWLRNEIRIMCIFIEFSCKRLDTQTFTWLN